MAMILDDIVERLARLSREHDEPELPKGPRAAVAAILRERPGRHEGGADLFFIRRAEHPTDPWSGHIAFPGGRRDPGDATLLTTAIRETREEVGIHLGHEHLVGRLPDVPAHTSSGLVVTPFVFAIRGDVVVSPNREVADTLWVPFRSLACGEGRGTFEWSWEGKMLTMPCIRLLGASASGDPAQPVLWGMTYRMLETMIEALTR